MERKEVSAMSDQSKEQRQREAYKKATGTMLLHLTAEEIREIGPPLLDDQGVPTCSFGPGCICNNKEPDTP